LRADLEVLRNEERASRAARRRPTSTNAHVTEAGAGSWLAQQRRRGMRTPSPDRAASPAASVCNAGHEDLASDAGSRAGSCGSDARAPGRAASQRERNDQSAEIVRLRKSLEWAEHRCQACGEEEATAKAQCAAARSREYYSQLELEAVQEQLTVLETTTAEASLAEGRAKEQVRLHKHRTSELAQVINELALQADLAQVGIIEEAVELKREASVAEQRWEGALAAMHGHRPGKIRR